MAAMSYDIWLTNYIAEQKARAERLRATQHLAESTISAPQSPACGRKRSCDSIIVVDDDEDLSAKRPKSSSTASCDNGTASVSPPRTPVGLPTPPSRAVGATCSHPPSSAFRTPASSSVSPPTIAHVGNQPRPVKGQCYITLPTIPPVRILVPEDSPLALQFNVSNDIENLMRLRRDSLHHRQQSEVLPAAQTLRRPQPIAPVMRNTPATSAPSHPLPPVVFNGVQPVMPLPATSLSFNDLMQPTTTTLTSHSAINDRLYGYLLHEVAKSLHPPAEMPHQMIYTLLANSPSLSSAFQASKLNPPAEPSKPDGISYVSPTMAVGNGIAAPTCPHLVDSMRQHHSQKNLSQRQCSMVL